MAPLVGAQSNRITAATLSPDGRWLAYAVNDGPVAALSVCDLDAGYTRHTLFSDVGTSARRGALARASVDFVGWADAHTLVYATHVPTAEISLSQEVHAVDATGTGDRVIFRTRDVETSYLMPLSAGGNVEQPTNFPDSVPVDRTMRVIGFDPTMPGTVLVEATGSRLVPTDVYRVDLKTGDSERLAVIPDAVRVLYDVHGMPRIRETPRVVMPPLGSGAAPRSRLPIAVPPVRAEPQIERQRFEYHGPAPHGFWHPLNRLAGITRVPGFTVDDSDYYQPRPFPLGFAADPNVLYIASNLGRNTYGIYGLDLTIGKSTGAAIEDDAVDLADPAEAMTGTPLVLDRQHRLVGVRVPGVLVTTRWLDPALAQLQRIADARFTERSTQFLDWSDAKTRVLMRVWGPGAPARYFIFDATAGPTFTEVLRTTPSPRVETRGDFGRAEPWRPELRRAVPRPGEPAPAVAFSFRTPAGGTLHGVVTLARNARLHPPPLVIICPNLPQPATELGADDGTAQQLALQGYEVVQVAYRGSAGFGLRHRDAIQAGYDRIPLEDITVTMTWLASHHPYDRRRVGLLGYGFGAYVALRAMELQPSEFRAAAAFDPPIDFTAWIDSSDPRLRGPAARPDAPGPRRSFFAPLARQVQAIALDQDITAIRHPILLLAEDLQQPGTVARVRAFHDRLARLGREAEFVATRGGPGPSAITRVVQFFNANVYDYRVEVGKEREVK